MYYWYISPNLLTWELKIKRHSIGIKIIFLHRVEESDFIAFMKRESLCVLKKAHRVRDAAALFRSWLGKSTVDPNASTTQKAKSRQFILF